MIVSKYIRGDRCDSDKDYIESETYDEVLLALKRKSENCVELTKGEANAIAELIDRALYREIRDDDDIENIQWVRNIIHGYDKLCEYSGYDGLTEGGEE